MKRRLENSENSPARKKRNRNDLSLIQKKEILEYHCDNSKITQHELAVHFTNKFKLSTPIGRSTISDILKKSDYFENTTCFQIRNG